MKIRFDWQGQNDLELKNIGQERLEQEQAIKSLELEENKQQLAEAKFIT